MSANGKPEGAYPSMMGLSYKVLKGAEKGKSPLLSGADWAPGCDSGVYDRVAQIIGDLEKGGEEKALDYAQKLDNWPAEKKTLLLTASEIEKQVAVLSESARNDIAVQMDRIRKFAVAQMSHMNSFEMELSPGVYTGQKIVPLNAAGCYVPGGRYSHISSAAMTVATAKAAGVKHVVAASPPMRGTTTIHPATLYAMHLAGADSVLVCGGAHAIGSLAFGLFTGAPADIIVGPGNSFVAEAKRFLYGRVGIDMFAGPTEILCLADSTGDARILATDLVSQAEHGPTSPAWFFTTCPELAEQVEKLVPELIEALPEGNPARESWPDYGEIILLPSRDDMRQLSDLYAAEHLEVHCKDDLDWWLSKLTNYGSLFLGEETCVSYGDKISGPNHALPTLRASRYTGGLSVDKYVKKLTYQRMTRDANRELGPLCARISRMEGMEAHARAADERLAQWFPEEQFELKPKMLTEEAEKEAAAAQ
ncbi:unnamed protein product [Amoebophrya sp. A25]|nr:unnamed protein product [Amoebophrya sp. A25]|eukprot:GSA25T00002924001.1